MSRAFILVVLLVWANPEARTQVAARSDGPAASSPRTAHPDPALEAFKKALQSGELTMPGQVVDEVGTLAL